MNGNLEGSILSLTELSQYKNRYIKKLESKNKELKINNKALSGGILTWENKNLLNKVIRLIATDLNIPFAFAWNKLYDELLYKHSISLKMRGKKPYVNHIREDEWEKLVSSLSAICEKNGLSFKKILDRVDKDFNFDGTE